MSKLYNIELCNMQKCCLFNIVTNDNSKFKYYSAELIMKPQLRTLMNLYLKIISLISDTFYFVISVF